MSLGAFAEMPIRSLPFRSGRVGLEVPVDLQMGDSSCGGVTQNLSPTGAFVATPRLLPVGSRITLRLSVPDPNLSLTVGAEVRWLRSGLWGEGAGQPAGMGVRFVDPPIGVSLCLDELLLAYSGR